MTRATPAAPLAGAQHGESALKDAIMTDAPQAGPSGREVAAQALALEEATGKGDAEKVVTQLTVLRQLFTEQDRKSWPQETVKRLWASVITAMRWTASPEVRPNAACPAASRCLLAVPRRRAKGSGRSSGAMGLQGDRWPPWRVRASVWP